MVQREYDVPNVAIPKNESELQINFDNWVEGH